jgi:hypothetical protein
LESTDTPDRVREAFNNLEISNGFVKCQNCGALVRIVGKLPKPKEKNDRIAILHKQIK